MLTVRAAGLTFQPDVVTVHSGDRVTVVFDNADPTVLHNLTIRAADLADGQTCEGPCRTSQTFTAPAPGAYRIVCTVHSFAGMTGTLVVQ